mgnify:FL=1
MDQTYMKKENVLKLLITMALPMVISMLVNSLYNIVDSFFVAQISEDAMTAISLVFPMQNFINSVMIGFGIGINSVISFYMGAQDKVQADKAASQGILLATIHGIVMTAGCIMLIKPFLCMFTNDSSIVELGLQYSYIAFAFSTILAWQLVFEKTFQAVGRMTASMTAMLGGCITNIVLDPMLIFGIGIFPDLGIRGAAIATGIGQTVSLLVYVIIYILRPMPVRFTRKCMKPEKTLCLKMYSVGIPASLNMALPSLLISALNVILAAFSQTYVFVLGVYYKLQTFLYLPANGVVQGMRPLIGYNYGAGEHKRVKKIYSTATIIVLIIMCAGTAICLEIPDKLIGLFTTNANTISAGARALRIISAGFIVSSVSVTASGALEGLGKGLPSLVISVFRYAVIIIPVAFILSRIYEVNGVWWSFGVTELVTAFISYIIYKKATHHH